MSSEKLSMLAETLIGSEIVKLGNEIKERKRQGEFIYNYTIGDFDSSIFPIPKELELPFNTILLPKLFWEDFSLLPFFSLSYAACQLSPWYLAAVELWAPACPSALLAAFLIVVLALAEESP